MRRRNCGSRMPQGRRVVQHGAPCMQRLPSTGAGVTSATTGHTNSEKAKPAKLAMTSRMTACRGSSFSSDNASAKSPAEMVRSGYSPISMARWIAGACGSPPIASPPPGKVGSRSKASRGRAGRCHSARWKGCRRQRVCALRAHGIRYAIRASRERA